MNHLKKRYFKKLNSDKDKMKLRLEAIEAINEIARLKGETRNNEDKLLTVVTKISRLLTDLKYEEDILHDITTSESKLKKIRSIIYAN